MQSAAERQIASRFSSQRQPASHATTGKTPTKFLTARLNQNFDTVPTAAEFREAAKTKDDLTIREALVERLLQIAFTDRVVVVGYDHKAKEPIERVSSAECLKAIQMLQQYDMGKAPDSLNPLQLAEHIRQVERDRVAAVISVLGSKMREMSPTQLAEFFSQCANDPAKFLIQAAQIASEMTGVAQDGPRSAVAELENASPKDRDMADHAPDATAANGQQPELPAEKPEGGT